ncbi:MAG TPA: hypothetical protein VGF55_16470 [Gemmataceae bacterium]
MEVPPKTPAPAGGPSTVAADAYELFWDCVENDAPVGDEPSPSETAPADAYGQFWELADI